MYETNIPTSGTINYVKSHFFIIKTAAPIAVRYKMPEIASLFFINPRGSGCAADTIVQNASGILVPPQAAPELRLTIKKFNDR